MNNNNDIFSNVARKLKNSLNYQFRGFIDGNGNLIYVPEYLEHKYYAANEVNKYFETHNHKTYEYYKLIYDFPNFAVGENSNRDPILDFLYTGAIYISNIGGIYTVAFYKDVYDYNVEVNGISIPAWKILKRIACSKEYNLNIYTKYEEQERPKDDIYINSAKIFKDKDDDKMSSLKCKLASQSPKRILNDTSAAVYSENGELLCIIDLSTGLKHPVTCYTNEEIDLFKEKLSHGNNIE